MSRNRREDQLTRWRQFYQSLPPIQRGIVISALLAFALPVVAVDSVLAVAVTRGLGRGWRKRRLGAVTAIRAGTSPVLCGALAAAAAQWLLRKWLAGTPA